MEFSHGLGYAFSQSFLGLALALAFFIFFLAWDWPTLEFSTWPGTDDLGNFWSMGLTFLGVSAVQCRARRS